MLYGAHGQPLGPAGPHGHPQYSYPPPGPGHYPPQPYPYQAPPYPPWPWSPYGAPGQAPPAQHEERVNLKRPPPDDDPHNENSHTSQSPHSTARPRHGTYDSRANGSGSYTYPDPTSGLPTSPATSTMSSQSYPQQPSRYPNGTQSQKGNASPPSGPTPSSAQSFNSPHHGPTQDDGRTPPSNPPNSAGSSANGRSGMKVHELIGRNDDEMLGRLDGKQ